LIAGGWSQAGLWFAVLASGFYHGLNPAMGWPLAVSNGLMQRRERALLGALVYLAAGHVLAMFVVMLPFALLAILLAWQREIQLGASVFIIGFGVFLLATPSPRTRAHSTFTARTLVFRGRDCARRRADARADLPGIVPRL
jgi:hypothetical protein